MELTQRGISNAVRAKSEAAEKIHALRGKSNALDFSDATPRKLAILDVPHVLEIGHALCSESWQPGQLHPNLSWTNVPEEVIRERSSPDFQPGGLF